MTQHTTYSKTYRGELAHTKKLPATAGQVLGAIEKNTPEQALLSTLKGVSPTGITTAITWLLKGGFIKTTSAESPITETKSVPPVEPVSDVTGKEKMTRHKTKLETLVVADEGSKQKPTEKVAAKPEEAEKEQKRLARIAAVKQAALAKARETKHLKSEAKIKHLAEINAKKKEWKHLKSEADKKNKALVKEYAAIKTKKKATAHAHTKKVLAQEEEATKQQAKVQRKINRRNSRFTLFIKQVVSGLLTGLKSLLALAIVAIFIILITAHFINIPSLANTFEKMASTQLQESVRVSSAHIWLLPKPHILIKNITTKDASTIQAENIRIYPNYSNMKEKFFNETNKPYTIQSLEVEGLNIGQKDLPHLNKWLQTPSHQTAYHLKSILFEGLILGLNAIKLPPLHGEASLNASGIITKVQVHTADKNFQLKALYDNNQYSVVINANNWQTPAFPHLLLSQLNASGMVNNQGLHLPSITGSLYGGQFNGSLRTDLTSPTLKTKGDFNINHLAITNIPGSLQLNEALTGLLTSSGHYSFNIDRPSNAIEGAKLNATFAVNNGMLKKVDIAEAMRTNNIHGTTNFSTLTGQVSTHNKGYQFKNLSLLDKQLQAKGKVDLSENQQVSASLSSSITIRDKQINANLNISGTLSNLVLNN